MREGLKQRLVGAFVLAAIGVLFLPSIFKEQSGHQIDTRTQIPPAPEPRIVSIPAPAPTVVVDAAPQPETMFVPDDEIIIPHDPIAAVYSASSSSSSLSSSAAASAIKSAVSISSAPSVVLNENSLPNAWVIQLASLGNKAAAVKLKDDLQKQGYRAYLREVTMPNGVFTRVFVGPNLDINEANRLKVELDKRLQINSQVKRFEP